MSANIKTQVQATLTIKNGPDAGTVIDLPQAQGELLIGRVEPAGLVINDSEVSRRHARLTFRDGRYYLEDLRSVNGTILRGQRISGECDLSNGDEIFIGSKVILVFHQIQQKPELAPESPESIETRLQGMQIPSPDATMFDSGEEFEALLSEVSAPASPQLLVTVAGNEPDSPFPEE